MDISHNDDRKNLEEMIKKIIEQSLSATMDRPGAFGFKIVISGAGIPVGDGIGFAAPDTHEPPVEVFVMGDEVRAVTELPGVDVSQVSITLVEDTLLIRGCGDSCQYETRTTLPPVDRESCKATMKHGVLEVTFTSVPPAEAPETVDRQPGD